MSQVKEVGIKYITGDIFKSRCQIIIITVNCLGIMGAGIAKQCKMLFPATYKKYREQCKRRAYVPGQPILTSVDRPLLLFPTKNDWRNPSRIEWIEEGLKRIARNSHQFESIAIPPLGCGHGGLKWNEVKALIEKHLGGLDNYIEVYEPKQAQRANPRFKTEYIQNDKDRIHSRIVLE